MHFRRRSAATTIPTLASLPADNLRYVPIPSRAPTQMKDWEQLNNDMAVALLKEIRNVQHHARASKPSSHDSLYTGLSGIAFMEYHIANIKLPLQNEALSRQSLYIAADKTLAKVLERNPIDMEYMYSPTRLSFLESFIGIAALVIFRGLSTSSTTEQIIVDNWHLAKQFMESALEKTLAADDVDYSPGDKEDGCEVLYGRAGMLYTLLFLRKTTQWASDRERKSMEWLLSDKTLSRLIDSIIARGTHGGHLLSTEFRTGQIGLPPLMWTWHGKRYLGAAHGVAGILEILLECPIPMIEKHLHIIFDMVLWLVNKQGEKRNWPSKCPSSRGVSGIDKDLVQWCHGASGIVLVLAKAVQILTKHKNVIKLDLDSVDKLYASLTLGAQLVYHQGLLKKGVGLCHGISGNVYALLAASDALDGQVAIVPNSRPNSRPATPNGTTKLTPTTNLGPYYFAKAAHLAFLGTFFDDPDVLPGMAIPDHPWSLYEGMAGMCCAWAEILNRMDSKKPKREISGFPGFDDL